MASKVSEMTATELKEMIETIVEQKLLELLGDPDEGLSLRKSLLDGSGVKSAPWQRASAVFPLMK